MASEMTAEFTSDEVARCRAAMSKSAPIDALRLIASGRVLIELSHDRRDVFIDSFDGQKIRDEEGRKAFLAGAWPLYRAGMIDQFGCITEAGRRALSEGGGT